MEAEGESDISEQIGPLLEPCLVRKIEFGKGEVCKMDFIVKFKV